MNQQKVKHLNSLERRSLESKEKLCNKNIKIFVKQTTKQQEHQLSKTTTFPKLNLSLQSIVSVTNHATVKENFTSIERKKT